MVATHRRYRAVAQARPKRLGKFKILTKEQAVALAAKWKAEAFEGRLFVRPKTLKLTVRQAWEDYAPISSATRTPGRSTSAGRAI